MRPWAGSAPPGTASPPPAASCSPSWLRTGRTAADELAAAVQARAPRTNRSTEIPGQLLDGLASTIRDRYGFILSQHRFAITGCCARCR